MKTKLIIAAIACLGLAACQQQDSGSKKEEKKAAAEQSETTGTPSHEAPAQPSATPAAPTSYYDNSQQNMAEQANPAIDTQQETAQSAAPDASDAMQMSQQAETAESAAQ